MYFSLNGGIFENPYFQIELLLRIVFAAFCGAAIGYERKNRFKEAGLRTHLIVALASCVLMIVSKYAFFDVVNGTSIRLDPSRIASCIVTGVGFLGAGTIFVRKQVVNGLTTAAGIWATAGLGMSIGAGMYIVGGFSTIIIILAQIILHKNLKFLHLPTSDLLLITVDNSSNSISKVRSILHQNEIEVQNFKAVKNNDDDTIIIEAFIKTNDGFTHAQIMDIFAKYDFIKSVEC